MKYRDRTIRVEKTKALISFAVTAKLICVFVFAYAKSRFSHNKAHVKKQRLNRNAANIVNITIKICFND